MQENLYIAAAIGGLCIGAASLLMLIFNGRVLGISGIAFSLLTPRQKNLSWRILFLAGLLAGAFIAAQIWPNIRNFQIAAPLSVLLLGGFCVGYGTRLGGGCTSGHGICGVGRFSSRSLIATVCFLVVGMITAFLTHHIFGASP